MKPPSDFVCAHCGWEDFFFTDDTGERACLECGAVENSEGGTDTPVASDSGVVAAAGGATGRLRPVARPVLNPKETKVTKKKSDLDAQDSQPASLADEAFFANVLYYGKPKSGKTTHAASVAKLGRIEYIDAEAGLKNQALVQFGVPTANIHPNREITMDALDALFWELKDDPPTALVWDSISESHKKLLALTAQRRYERDIAAGKKVWEQYAIELGDYGVNTNEMRTLSRQFRDLECHTAFVALEKRDQDDKTGIVQYGPDMTAKLAEDILGYVDVICHTYTIMNGDEQQCWGAFRTFDLHVAGDRFNTLPPRLINPSMDRIIKYLTFEMDIDNDPEMQAEFARVGHKEIVNEPAPTDDGGEKVLRDAGLKPTPTEVGKPTAPAATSGRGKRPPRPVVNA